MSLSFLSAITFGHICEHEIDFSDIWPKLLGIPFQVAMVGLVWLNRIESVSIRDDIGMAYMQNISF